MGKLYRIHLGQTPVRENESEMRTKESVEQTVKELRRLGIECEPIRVDDYTGKKMTFFHDPDGLPLELHE